MITDELKQRAFDAWQRYRAASDEAFASPTGNSAETAIGTGDPAQVETSIQLVELFTQQLRKAVRRGERGTGAPTMTRPKTEH